MPDINRADLNRAISEAIEPEPRYPPANSSVYISEHGGWRWVYERETKTVNKGSFPITQTIDVGRWQPRAWDTDETANAFARDMLLTEIGFSDWAQLVKREYLELQAAIKDCGQRYRTANRNALYEWLTQRQGVK